MKELKFTKGKWEIKKDEISTEIVKGKLPICLLPKSTMNPNTEANALLISASPDLLEACIEFVRKVDAGEARSTKSYNQMKQAISKAIGED
jgi:hypothetical protein